MALSFSIESILARPTYRPIAPAVYSAIQPYPCIFSANTCPVSSALTFATLPGSRKRRKRYRTIFSEMQIELLEGLFRVTQYPDLYQRENVAFKAGLQEERVEVWFKNRRARNRKLMRAEKSSSEKSEDENEKEGHEKTQNDTKEENTNENTNTTAFLSP